jgi:predicted transcriptional regulator
MTNSEATTRGGIAARHADQAVHADNPVLADNPVHADNPVLAGTPVPAEHGAHADPAGRRGSGELEAAVLASLQAAGRPLSPGEVRDLLDADLAYTTVVTILSRLHGKGVLERRKAGRSYAYVPVADEPGLAARRMARVLDGEADREAVLARFVSGLSGDDEELLRRMLDERGP